MNTGSISARISWPAESIFRLSRPGFRATQIILLLCTQHDFPSHSNAFSAMPTEWTQRSDEFIRIFLDVQIGASSMGAFSSLFLHSDKSQQYVLMSYMYLLFLYSETIDNTYPNNTCGPKLFLYVTGHQKKNELACKETRICP
jgi:hypothetical protein